MALTQNQRTTIGSCVLSAATKKKAPSQIVVKCVDKTAGEASMSALKAAYPSYKYYKAENRAGNTAAYIATGLLAWGLIPVLAVTQTWKNFTVKTTSPQAAEALVAEINDCIAGGTPYTPNSNAAYEGGDDTTESATKGNRTLLIAGAAALAVVVVLFVAKKMRRK